MNVDVLYIKPHGFGWEPISRLAEKMTKYFSGNLFTLSDSGVTKIDKIFSCLPISRGGDFLIVLSPIPEHLLYARRFLRRQGNYKTIVAWVIDSWWDNRIPKSFKYLSFFDHVYVTELEMVSIWRALFSSTVSWLPLGSDVLSEVLGMNSKKTIDLQRIGRQPVLWDDDVSLELVAKRIGLTFRGRPPFSDNSQKSIENVLMANREAKRVLAFSNLMSPANYTHPNREYVTSRWLDALACGAKVVGVRPREEGSDDLLWDGATLDIPVDDVERGLQMIKEDISREEPGAARERQLEALKRFDWAWRFKQIADDFHLDVPLVDSRIDRINGILSGEDSVL
ncbi:glycosyltransferase [Actinomyces vulturis]|uniref:glycosyltransferase n=1 Tax=Actinomyces vulturis TaxID=1857645 RepID=UPI00083475AB|nr:glycosyltransferase [Actinomyces vulturis]